MFLEFQDAVQTNEEKTSEFLVGNPSITDALLDDMFLQFQDGSQMTEKKPKTPEIVAPKKRRKITRPKPFHLSFKLDQT